MARQRIVSRKSGFDYSSPGAYFITCVAFQRSVLFGEIAGGEMGLNPVGEVIWEVWRSLPGRFPHIKLDEAVVMPDHFHGIIRIIDNTGIDVGAIHESPLHQPPLSQPHLPQTQATQSPQSVRRKMLIPLVVGYFKMNTARRINLLLDSTGVPVWQRGYYDHIIADERELFAVRACIRENPRKWESDPEEKLFGFNR